MLVQIVLVFVEALGALGRGLMNVINAMESNVLNVIADAYNVLGSIKTTVRVVF